MTQKIFTGRRKNAVARVRLSTGNGQFRLNGRPLEDYFPIATLRADVLRPFRITETEGMYDVDARIHGGGVAGQAGALRLGIARALEEDDPERRPPLKADGLLRRDARKVERKKYGLKKARKAPQYSKR